MRVTLSSTIAGGVRARPAVFTPNGDGVNDETAVTYSILHLLAPSPVAVEVLDLAGRRVRRLRQQQAISGRYTVWWDGRDANGDLVLPGVYLVAVEIAADGGTERRVGQVAVAY